MLCILVTSGKQRSSISVSKLDIVWIQCLRDLLRSPLEFRTSNWLFILKAFVRAKVGRLILTASLD
jgi:hypothetical protein